MREILFRGKRKNSGKWIFGSIVHQTDYYGDKVDRWFIVEGDFTNDYDIDCTIEVQKETVGQYTGLLDKNGKRIFEGDVVAYREYGNFAVAWDDGAFQFMREDTFYDMLDHYTNGFAVVIGNIHDNPELLEGGGEE
jgi:hypothetical protein